eukprot:scaffold3.g6284.t1
MATTGTQKMRRERQERQQQMEVLVGREKLWGTLGVLALTGATTGTFLDGIHSRVGLLVYDVMPLQLGSLHTSACVPPLLALFYVVLGGLCCWTDTRMGLAGDGATHAALRRSSLSMMALSFGALAATLAVSSLLYERHASVAQISVCLMAISGLNYLVFDGTKQGLGIATLCALVAPLCELLLLQIFGLWHYPEANAFLSVGGGMPSWVVFCYFVYCPAVLTLSRYLMKVL